MNEVGLQDLAAAHNEVTGWLEIARAVGNSYRLASSGLGFGALYGRFIFTFCRTIVAVVAR